MSALYNVPLVKQGRSNSDKAGRVERGRGKDKGIRECIVDS